MTHRPLRRGMCVWNCPNCIERGIWRPDLAGHVQAADAVSVHPTEHLPRAGAHLQQHSSWGRRHVRGDKCPALWSTVSVIPVTGPCQPDLRNVARILFQSRQGWKGQSSARRMSATRKGNGVRGSMRGAEMTVPLAARSVFLRPGQRQRKQ